MKIEHLAIWTKNLEAMKQFYQTFFQMSAGKKYHNPHKNFTSYFLSFENGARIELMHRPEHSAASEQGIGLAHFAISLGSKQEVDAMTDKLRSANITIIGDPRFTGDGYYESVIADPEGNLIELTI